MQAAVVKVERRGKKKIVRDDLMKGIDSEAEQRLLNASHQEKQLAFDGSVVQELRSVVHGLVQHLQALLHMSTTSQAPLQKLQAMFRILGVHNLVFDTITSLMSNDSARMPQDADLSLLLYNCFSFLALFARGQAENQEILFPQLDTMILPQLNNPTTVFSAAAQAFIAVVHKNRVIASRFDDKMYSSLMGCIKASGSRADYLRCLAAVCCPQDIPVRRNQIRVLEHLLAQVGGKDKIVRIVCNKLHLIFCNKIHSIVSNQFHVKGIFITCPVLTLKTITGELL